MDYGIDITNHKISPEWLNINNDFDKLNNKLEINNLTPTSVRVNTMTLVTYLKNTTMDLEELMTYLNKMAPDTA